MRRTTPLLRHRLDSNNVRYTTKNECSQPATSAPRRFRNYKHHCFGRIVLYRGRGSTFFLSQITFVVRAGSARFRKISIRVRDVHSESARHQFTQQELLYASQNQHVRLLTVCYKIEINNKKDSPTILMLMWTKMDLS